MGIRWDVLPSHEINVSSSDHDSVVQIRGDGQIPAAATGFPIPFPGPFADQELPGFPILNAHFSFFTFQ